MSSIQTQFANKPLAILVNGEESSNDIQAKLFKLGFGFFNGRYPLSQRYESLPTVNAVLVAPSGHLYVAMEMEDTGNAVTLSATDFLALDFSSEQSRITDKIALTKRRFETKSMLYALSQVKTKDLSPEQMDSITQCHNQICTNGTQEQ
jgi:hypothetical protein